MNFNIRTYSIKIYISCASIICLPDAWRCYPQYVNFSSYYLLPHTCSHSSQGGLDWSLCILEQQQQTKKQKIIYFYLYTVLFYLFLCVSFSHYTILRLRTQVPKHPETLFPQLLSCSWLHGFSCKQNLLTWGSQFCKSTFYLPSASCFPDNSTATVGSNLQKFQVVNGVDNYFL